MLDLNPFVETELELICRQPRLSLLFSTLHQFSLGLNFVMLIVHLEDSFVSWVWTMTYCSNKSTRLFLPRGARSAPVAPAELQSSHTT